MVWKIRRVDELAEPPTDVISPVDYATAADAMDVALTNAVQYNISYMSSNPTGNIGTDIRTYRMLDRNDLRIRFKIGNGDTVQWIVNEQP